MNHFKSFLFAISLATPIAYADQISIQVTVGDRSTHIELQSQDQKYSMTTGSNDFPTRQSQIGEKNFAYIQKRLAEISKLDSKKEACPRERIEVKFKIKEEWVPQFEVCLLANTEQSESMKSLLNTLSFAY